MRILAVIPARGGSKRLPHKNTREFLGRPLIHWSIAFARALGVFDSIVVSTDSQDIANCCSTAGLQVPWLRPAELASDTADSVDVVLDALARERAAGRDAQWIALLQPTSPLRDLSRWQQALALAAHGGCEAVVGVSPVREHPCHSLRLQPGGYLHPWVSEDALRKRSQDLPEVVRVNGSLYLVRTDVLVASRTFFPPTAQGVLCDQPWEAIDIDTEADWVAGEALGRHYRKAV